VRATTAFNKMLTIPGADVAGVVFTPTGIVVALRRRARRLRCPCGWSTRAVYDHSTRRWRHLDLGASRLYLQAEIRRLACRACGRVRTETVPWARPGARFTRDFEDVVAYLAQRTDKTTITRLLRCSWEAVAAIVVRVVAAHIDDARLDGLYHIGVDEVSYRKGHRYLTVVADHDRDGAVVWIGEGKSGATLEAFFAGLGPERAARLQAASMDLHGAHAKVTATHAPQARVCADPFHVVKLANHAVDQVRRVEWNTARHAGGILRRPSGRIRTNPAADLIKHTRWALLKDPGHLTATQHQLLDRLRRARHVLFRAWALKEELRDLYRLPTGRHADAHLDAWLARACRSRIPAMVALSKTIRAHHQQILAAVELGLSNSKLEGLNSKIRLINHRGYGHYTAAAVIAMIYLCCSGIPARQPCRAHVTDLGGFVLVRKRRYTGTPQA
jgi:transposase